MAKLSAKIVDSLKVPGFCGDGEGLYLKVGAGGAKSWILRTVVHAQLLPTWKTKKQAEPSSKAAPS